MSWGGATGAILPAVEKRIRANVLHVAGLHFQRALPEADAVNYVTARLEAQGDPFPVESSVEVAGWGGGASFAVSRKGTSPQTGGELFYWRDSTLMAIRVSTTGSSGREAATTLFTMDDARLICGGTRPPTGRVSSQAVIARAEAARRGWL